MIIKLTECRHVNGETENMFPIWVNMDNFITMNKSINGGKDTHIKLVGAFLFVKETPEEIMQMMEPPMIANLTEEELERYSDYQMQTGYISYGAR